MRSRSSLVPPVSTVTQIPVRFSNSVIMGSYTSCLWEVYTVSLSASSGAYCARAFPFRAQPKQDNAQRHTHKIHTTLVFRFIAVPSFAKDYSPGMIFSII